MSTDITDRNGCLVAHRWYGGKDKGAQIDVYMTAATYADGGKNVAIKIGDDCGTSLEEWLDDPMQKAADVNFLLQGRPAR